MDKYSLKSIRAILRRNSDVVYYSVPFDKERNAIIGSTVHSVCNWILFAAAAIWFNTFHLDNNIRDIVGLGVIVIASTSSIVHLEMMVKDADGGAKKQNYPVTPWAKWLHKYIAIRDWKKHIRTATEYDLTETFLCFQAKTAQAVYDKICSVNKAKVETIDQQIDLINNMQFVTDKSDTILKLQNLKQLLEKQQVEAKEKQQQILAEIQIAKQQNEEYHQFAEIKKLHSIMSDANSTLDYNRMLSRLGNMCTEFKTYSETRIQEFNCEASAIIEVAGI